MQASKHPPPPTPQGLLEMINGPSDSTNDVTQVERAGRPSLPTRRPSRSLKLIDRFIDSAGIREQEDHRRPVSSKTSFEDRH